MRPGQNKRMRGRNNNRRGPNPLTRSYESNGPDVKIRGNAQHVAEKYLQLARDAHTSGDPVGAENYLQHAEHYFRIIASAQAAQQQMQAGFGRPQIEGESEEIDDDDDVGGLSDRFASPIERAPMHNNQPNFGNGPQPQPQGQPFQERAPYENGERQPQGMERPYQGGGGRPNNRMEQRDNRDNRDNRGPRGDRPYQDRQEQRGDNRDNRGGRGPFRPYRDRDQQPMRGEGPQPAAQSPSGLPSFISAPVRMTPAPENDEVAVSSGETVEAQEAAPSPQNEAEPRFRGRRRRPRPNFNFDNQGGEQREEAQDQPDQSEAPAGE